VQIEDIFCQGGVFSKKMPGYETRDGQVEMCKLVNKAYEEDAICVIEAGTGIGKSYAYLVPAIYHAINTEGERTVVSTATINLQDQLFTRDIRQLFAMLGVECSVAVAIGRRNYVCIERAEEYLNQRKNLRKDLSTFQGKFDQWFTTTDDGLLGNCDLKLGSIYSKVNCDPDYCLKGRCKYFKSCFYMKAKEEQQNADIIITNHHMLFTDSKSRKEKDLGYDDDAVLPRFSHLVVDEAHNIVPIATEFFAKTFDGKEVLRTLAKIKQKHTYSQAEENEDVRGVHVDTRHAAQSLTLLDILAHYSRQGNDVQQVFDALQTFEESVVTFQTFMEMSFAKNQVRPVYVPKNAYPRLMRSFVPAARKLIDDGSSLQHIATDYLTHLQIPSSDKNYQNDFEGLLNNIEASVSNLSDFIDFPQWENDIHWFDLQKQNDGKATSVRIIISPLEVASLLEQNLYDKLKSIVFASATLDLGDNFNYWCGEVGLPFGTDRKFMKASYPSPFDYKNNLMLLTPYDTPLVSRDAQKSEEYYIKMADIIFEAVNSSGGGALILFTSRVAMKSVYALVQERFEDENLKLMMQGENLGKQQLLEQFRHEGNATLFALSSFWEGIDVPGSALRLVVIVKLPFPVPNHPIIKAKSEFLEGQQKSSFMHIQLPDAMMKMKQGFGRLIRSSQDHGVVLVLDSRIMSKGYGQMIIKALPECDWQPCYVEGISTKIESFLYG